jgi:hypothetical protein
LLESFAFFDRVGCVLYFVCPVLTSCIIWLAWLLCTIYGIILAINLSRDRLTRSHLSFCLLCRLPAVFIDTGGRIRTGPVSQVGSQCEWWKVSFGRLLNYYYLIVPGHGRRGFHLGCRTWLI